MCVFFAHTHKADVFVWVLWYINLSRLFNAKSILYEETVLFQTIQFSISTYFNCQKHFYFKPFHHHHVALSAWIFLTLSRYPSLSSIAFSRSSWPHPVSAVCMFELDVLPLLVPVKGSTGVYHLRARPYFSSSVLRVLFV